MREIKFRAWDKMIRELRYAIEIPSDYFERNGLCDLFNMFQNLSARYEFMQFTGLTDRNGKEIYEDSDILNGTFIVERRYVLKDISTGDIIDTNYKGGIYEVTKNIYKSS